MEGLASTRTNILKQNGWFLQISNLSESIVIVAALHVNSLICYCIVKRYHSTWACHIMWRMLLPRALTQGPWLLNRICYSESPSWCIVVTFQQIPRCRRSCIHENFRQMEGTQTDGRTWATLKAHWLFMAWA